MYMQFDMHYIFKKATCSSKSWKSSSLGHCQRFVQLTAASLYTQKILKLLFSIPAYSWVECTAVGGREKLKKERKQIHPL